MTMLIKNNSNKKKILINKAYPLRNKNSAKNKRTEMIIVSVSDPPWYEDRKIILLQIFAIKQQKLSKENDNITI